MHAWTERRKCCGCARRKLPRSGHSGQKGLSTLVAPLCTQVYRIAAILARSASGSRGDEHESTLLQLSVETTFLSGQRQFPESPLLLVLGSTFLRSMAPDSANAQAHAAPERAKSMTPDFGVRFLIFVAETEVKVMRDESHEEDEIEEPMDLQAFADYRKALDAVQRAHRAALGTTRRFWRILSSNSTVSFKSIASIFLIMDEAEAAAERMYKLTLEKYPKNVKLLRNFAIFVNVLRNDPWRAAKINQEADRLEAMAAVRGFVVILL